MTFFRKALIVIFTFLLVDGLNSGLTAKNLVKYAIATLPTPVLHTADFRGIFGGEDGETLRLDEDKQIKELEFIAFPKTVFKVEEIIEGNGKKIYKITTKDYPYPTDEGYFIDSRFVKTVEIKPPERPKELPSSKLLSRTFCLLKIVIIFGVETIKTASLKYPFFTNQPPCFLKRFEKNGC